MCLAPRRPGGSDQKLSGSLVLRSTLVRFGLSFGVLLAACGGTSSPTPADGTGSQDVGSVDGTSGGTDATGSTDAGTDAGGTKDASTTKPDTTTTPPPCKPWDPPGDWGCPPDTHCGFDDAEVIACLPNGEHGLGEECGDGKGCKIGMCITADDGKSKCTPYCLSDVHCDSGTCGKVEGKTKTKVCPVSSTYETCNPLSPKCSAGNCYYSSGALTFACVKKTGTGEVGDACEDHPACKPGLYCAGLASGTKGQCRKLCSPSGGATGCADPNTPCSKITTAVGYCEE